MSYFEVISFVINGLVAKLAHYQTKTRLDALITPCLENSTTTCAARQGTPLYFTRRARAARTFQLPLETATYTSDLVTSNPAHTDGLSQADSHMRLLKSTIKATFPNFTAAALVSTQAQLDAAVNGPVLGTIAQRFLAGTAALPGITPIGNTNTGIYSPAANQLAMSLNGVSVLALGSGSFVTTLAISAPLVASSGAYSGGTGQLVPVGATLLWWDDVLPAEGGYAWANGQIISSANTVCPVLLARWGTRFGGNGTTTMGVPDMRGAVPSGKDTMGAVASSGRLASIGAFAKTTMGAFFGSDTNVLAAANIPTITSVNASQTVSVTSSQTGIPSGGAGSPRGDGLTNASGSWYGPASLTQFVISQISSSGTNSISTTYTNASPTATNVVQPSTTCNYILRLA